MSVFNEVYKFMFILSVIYVLYVLCDLLIKTYSMFKLSKETRFSLNLNEKITFWVSLAITISYIT